jgi:hypothetical protein
MLTSAECRLQGTLRHPQNAGLSRADSRRLQARDEICFQGRPVRLGTMVLGSALNTRLLPTNIQLLTGRHLADSNRQERLFSPARHAGSGSLKTAQDEHVGNDADEFTIGQTEFLLQLQRADVEVDGRNN